MAATTKGNFLTNMNHEIRSAISGIIDITDLLMNTKLDKKQQDLATCARRSAKSLLMTINDYFDFSKIEMGKLDFQKINFNLRTSVENVSEVLSEKASKKGIEFFCLVKYNVPVFLTGDPGRIKQIIMNLADNAIHFTEMGEVSVMVDVDADFEDRVYLRFEISDTGVGIPTEVQDRLFVPFSDLDEPTPIDNEKISLGLVIVNQLVTAMNGEIKVESEVGKGSVFTVTIEIPKQKNQNQYPVSNAENIPSKRILVVDKNDSSRKLLVEHVKTWGCQFDESDSGEKAFFKLHEAASKNNAFDMVIIDANVIANEGKALSRFIKADPELATTSLIFVTDVGSRGDAAEAIRSGYSAYLTKPIRFNDMINCLNLVMANSQGQTEEQVDKPLVTQHLISDIFTDKPRILLAEDNLINQKLAVKMLDRIGIQSDIANNGLEAIQALKEKKYNLVLMDIEMPELDGVEATKQIRTVDSALNHSDIPIIAITAHAMESDKQKFLKSGMNDLIAKPISIAALRDVLGQYIPVSFED